MLKNITIIKNNQYKVLDSNYKILLLKKFFFKNKHNSLLGILNNNKLINNFYKNFINLSFSHNDLVLLNYMLIYLKNDSITYRHFFGYSIYGRTRSNNKSSNLKKIPFRSFLIKYVYSSLFKSFSKLDSNYLLLAEFFNKLWFFNWFNDWYYSNKMWLSLVENEKQWVFSCKHTQLNRPLLNRIKNSKTKTQAKLAMYPKNAYNVGFFFGFSLVFKKLILRSFKKKFNVINVSKKYNI